MACSSARAEVRLARIFGDHMVLQRDQPIRVWGWARPGEKVRVEFRGQSVQAVADAQGRWLASLESEPAGGPYELTIRGENSITLRDVLVGEVWVGSGQSNMEWSVKDSSNAVQELAQSDFPLIRHFKAPKTIAFTPAEDIGEAVWKVSGPGNTGEFSAAGYFFARKIHQELGVPVGIINTSWGGTHIETWISAKTLGAQPDFDLSSMPADAAGFAARYRERMKALISAWQTGGLDAEGLSEAWKEPDFNDGAWSVLRAPKLWEEQGLDDLDGVVWYRRAIELTPRQAASEAVLQLGTIDDDDETYLNGRRVGQTRGWDAPRRYSVPQGLLKPGRNVVAVRVTDTGGGGGFYGRDEGMALKLGAESVSLAGDWKARVESFLSKDEPGPNDLPTLLFNSMVSPITKLSIAGVLWYQGESNVPRAEQYARTFPLMIEDWRRQWGRPNLPFYFVQLASFLPLARNDLKGSSWAELRDAQRQTLSLPNTGMVVAVDIGDADSIHPLSKQAVGLRLALHALKNQYGKKVAAGGPMYRAMRVRGHEVELSFTDAGLGLVMPQGDAVLRGFAVADKRREFKPAQARIQGDKVIVSRLDMPDPKAVRYGWVDNPQESNLFNRDGLPASPFRTDDWPLQTAGKKYRY